MVNGTYPTWDELAAKYGTCRHPDCPDTNWHGRDRLHLRGPACPFSLDSTYRIAPLNRKDATMTTALSDIVGDLPTLHQLRTREFILVSRVAAILGRHMYPTMTAIARRAGLEPTPYESDGWHSDLMDIRLTTEARDRIKEREEMCASDFIDLLCAELDVTPAAAINAVRDAGFFVLPSDADFIADQEEEPPSLGVVASPTSPPGSWEDYLERHPESEEGVIVWEDNFVFKRRIKAITTASNVTGPCPPSLAAGPWTSQMLRVADWIMGETEER